MKKLITLFFLTGAVFPSFAFAQIGSSEAKDFKVGATNSFQLVPCSGPSANGITVDPTTEKSTTPCDFKALIILIDRIINLLLYAAIFIAVIMILYGGFLYLTAGGDTTKVKKAHSVFKATAIGMIMAFCSWIVVYTVVTYVIDPNFGGGASNIILLKKQ